MILWLLSLAVIVKSASLASTPNPQACMNNNFNVTLTSSGFTLPLTSYSYQKSCDSYQYSFVVPSGYYAYVELNALQLVATQVVITGDTAEEFTCPMSSNQYINCSHSLSFYSNFQIYLGLELSSATAQMAFKIAVQQQTPTANIVKSYITYPGSSSVFVYNDLWNDGESYKFTSKSGNVYVVVAIPNGGDRSEWNNILVYDGGILKGSLLKAAGVSDYPHQKPYISTSNEVILYCTKKVTTQGAALITDYSNVKNVAHVAQFVSSGPQNYIQYQSLGKESALTLITPRDSPSVTFYQLNIYDGSRTFTYISGGPIQNHSIAANFTSDQIPQTVAGYANTFYVNNGSGKAKYRL